MDDLDLHVLGIWLELLASKAKTKENIVGFMNNKTKCNFHSDEENRF
jgi:hypothetical protein